MKNRLLSVLILVIASSPAFASAYELKCQGNQAGHDLTVRTTENPGQVELQWASQGTTQYSAIYDLYQSPAIDYYGVDTILQMSSGTVPGSADDYAWIAISNSRQGPKLEIARTRYTVVYTGKNDPSGLENMTDTVGLECDAADALIERVLSRN